MAGEYTSKIGFGRGELGVLLLFFTISIIFYVGSYNYEGFVGQYPRFISLVIMFLTFIFIATRIIRVYFLPENITDRKDLQDDDQNWLPNKNVVGVAGFTGTYLLLSYLIGMLWATPLFVFSYLHWSGYKYRTSIGLAVLMLLAVIGLIYIFDFNSLDVGIIQNTL